MNLREELQQLPYLEKAIELERSRVQALRDSCGVKSPRFDAIPGGSGNRDKIGTFIPAAVDEEAMMLQTIREFSEKRESLLRFINGVSDARMRSILILRFIEQKSWQAVADAIDCGQGKETDYTVKQGCYRFLDAEEKKQARQKPDA